MDYECTDSEDARLAAAEPDSTQVSPPRLPGARAAITSPDNAVILQYWSAILGSATGDRGGKLGARAGEETRPAITADTVVGRVCVVLGGRTRLVERKSPKEVLNGVRLPEADRASCWGSGRGACSFCWSLVQGARSTSSSWGF